MWFVFVFTETFEDSWVQETNDLKWQRINKEKKEIRATIKNIFK